MNSEAYEDVPDQNPWTITVPDCVVCDDLGCSHCPKVDNCRRIPLFDRKGNLTSTAIVSDEDWESLQHVSWSRSSTGYASSKLGYMHRIIMGLTKGDGLEVDHKNHDTLDNRRENLRVVTHANNHKNRKRNASNTSGYPGVWKKRKRWAAQCGVGGKTKYIGTFDTAEEAAQAVREYREKHVTIDVEPWPAEAFEDLTNQDLQRLILDAQSALYRKQREAWGA